MPWKEMSKMEQKEEFILLYKTGKYTVTNLAQMFYISRKTAYKYIERYEKYGIPGLLEIPTIPRIISNKTSELIENEIVKLREKHPRWGAPKLRVLLEDKLPDQKLPEISTINLILKRNGLIKDRKKRYKTEPKKPKFDPGKANEIWSADFKGQFRLGNTKYCYPLTIADSYSRYVFAAKGMYSPNFKNTKSTFIEVFRRFGLPEQIHTDNGQPFGHIRSLGRLTQLSSWFMELDIMPVFSDPASPGQNGRHERMHRDLKGEATRPPGKNLQSQQVKLNNFIKEYNDIRPHESLGMRTPSAMHYFSERKFPTKIEPWVYPKEQHVRYVTHNGAVRIGRADWLFLTTALAGKEVGFEEIGNRIYKVFFRAFFLGYADMNNLKIYDIMTYKDELKL